MLVEGTKSNFQMYQNYTNSILYGLKLIFYWIPWSLGYFRILISLWGKEFFWRYHDFFSVTYIYSKFHCKIISKPIAKIIGKRFFLWNFEYMQVTLKSPGISKKILCPIEILISCNSPKTNDSKTASNPHLTFGTPEIFRSKKFQ